MIVRLPPAADPFAVAAPDIGRRRGGDLHRSLRAVWFGAPHFRIAAMARLCSVHLIGDAVENAARRRESRSAELPGLGCCRRWQNGPNRFKELRRRGVPKFHAAVAAGSPTGFWRGNVTGKPRLCFFST
jgi:hypothetical protein